MYKSKSVTVIFPTLNEEQNILNAINEFINNPYVDEVLVIDNGSTDSTRKIVHQTNAEYILESKRGYGEACITGIRNCFSDIIFLVEPDGTFSSNDIEKFLSYSNQFGAVFGSRTASALIWERAYMPNWIRFGNWLCAKVIEILFSGPSLSDVGCTYKLLTKETKEEIVEHLVVRGSHFSPHLMIECLKANVKCIEIPINYYARIGESKITGINNFKTIRLGLLMFFYIFFQRFKVTSYRLKQLGLRSRVKN